MHMYCADNGGRGPVGEIVPQLNVYTRNVQIFECPSNPGPDVRTFRIPATEPRSADDLGPGTAQEISLGYEFRPGVWSDDSPGRLIVQDRSADVHTRGTWQAARLDGAVLRFAAPEWVTMGEAAAQPRVGSPK